MTFSELVKRVARYVKYEREEVEEILVATVAVMASRLRSGEEVKVRGLGTFHHQYRKATRRKNPKTGEWVEVPEAYVLRFRPVRKLKKMKV